MNRTSLSGLIPPRGSLRLQLLARTAAVTGSLAVVGVVVGGALDSIPLRVVLGVVIVGGGVLAIAKVVASTLQPLDRLVLTARKMSGGETSIRAESSDTELGRLGRYLNVLVDRQKVTVGQAAGSQQKLQKLLASLPLEIGLFDGNGRFLYQKPVDGGTAEGARIAMGMTPGEFYALSGQETLGEEIGWAVRQCIETGSAVRIEHSEIDDSGAPTIVRVFTPVDPERGDAIRVVGYGIDVSDQRSAEAKLRESEEHLRRAQKMEEIGRLAGGVAQDFEGLVASTLSHTERALATDGLPDGAREHLEEVRATAVQAKVLTGQLLAFGRKQQLRPEWVDLGMVVRETEMMIRRMVGRHIRVESSHVDEAVMAHLDPSKIEQVLMRLVLNARDAMSDGGSLTIRTERLHLAVRPENATGHFEPGTYAAITIGDTGPGMDAAALARVFEPFVGQSGNGNNHGLGLSAVEGTVVQSGGFISVDSEPGRGTTFRIFFSVGGSAPKASAALGEDVASTGARRGTVLVATPDELFGEFVRLTLGRTGFEVLSAAEGGEAIEAARNHGAKLDLLLLDVALGGVGAADAARVVSAFHPDLPVLPIATSPTDVLEHETNLGSVLYIQEPYDAADFATAVEEALGQTHLHSDAESQASQPAVGRRVTARPTPSRSGGEG